jgi:hypothetical protein
MPEASLKAGSKWANRPDCSVEVVEAMVMNLSCAWPVAAAPSPAKTNAESSTLRILDIEVNIIAMAIHL